MRCLPCLTLVSHVHVKGNVFQATLSDLFHVWPALYEKMLHHMCKHCSIECCIVYLSNSVKLLHLDTHSLWVDAGLLCVVHHAFLPCVYFKVFCVSGIYGIGSAFIGLLVVPP